MKSSDALPDLSEKPSRFLRARWVVPLGLALVLIGGVCIFKTVMSSKVRSRIADLRKAGYPVTTSELNVWHKQVPVRENAALEVLAAASLLTTNGRRWDQIKWPESSEKLSPDLKSKLEEITTTEAPALRTLEPGLALEQSRYPIDWRPGPGTLLPHLSQVRSLAELLRAQAALAAGKGDSMIAAQTVDELAKLSRTLLSEPCLVSQFVRIRIAAYAVTSLERTLNECAFSQGDLEKLLKTFQSMDAETQTGLKNAFMGELSLGDYVFRAPVKELVAIGEFSDEYRFLAGFVKATGLQDRDHLFFLNAMAKSIQASEKDFPEALENARLIHEDVQSQTQRAPDLSLSRLLLPSMENHFQKFGSHHAQLRCAQMALAVEIYRIQNQGKPPASLDHLRPGPLKVLPIDPFTGTPLHYRPMPEGFLVYSVGSDERDDGGISPEDSSGGDRIVGILADGNTARTNRPADIPFAVWR